VRAPRAPLLKSFSAELLALATVTSIEVAMATHVHESGSSTASLWLRLVAWFFKLGSALFALMALLGFAGLIVGLPENSSYSAALSVLILFAFAICLLAAGVLLARRSRLGAILALLLNTYPIAFVLTGVRRFEWYDVVVPLLTIAVLISIWPQLSWHRSRIVMK
jgi:hypothetical protein